MAKIKEILCMSHSHLDIGYTHPQPMLLALQCDYIDQAIDLCIKTADYPEEAQFRWTCEATLPVTEWLKTASPERVLQLKQLIAKKRFSIAALPMHTTPGCDLPEMLQMTADVQTLREKLGAGITCAVNHDVNGQPWTMTQVLMDSGIDFYLTGINVHFGGVPFKRPAAFKWQAPDGRELLTFLGEHYSLFSQYAHTDEENLSRMEEGLKEYIAWLDSIGYDREWAFLTATNPPCYDNNAPDFRLPDLVRTFNETHADLKIRLVTVEDLKNKLLADGTSSLESARGDWTDYWNFGAGSTPRETAISRKAKAVLESADALAALQPQDKRRAVTRARAWDAAVTYDEHTWGAAQSIGSPDDMETRSQRLQKDVKAFEALDTAAYLLGDQMERLCGNSAQSMDSEGFAVVNFSAYPQTVPVNIPESLLKPWKRMRSLRIKKLLPYRNMTTRFGQKAFLDGTEEEMIYCGEILLKPYEVRVLSREELRNREKRGEQGCILNDSILTTPFYTVTLNPEDGTVLSVIDRTSGRELMDVESSWHLFDLVRETIDSSKDAEDRDTFFCRDVEKGNHSISVWNHGWHAVRKAATVRAWTTESGEDGSLAIIRTIEADGLQQGKLTILFSATDRRIRLHAAFKKLPVSTPEGLYVTFPLNLGKDWNCVYDTAGTEVHLDEEQIGKVSRDWVTVDKTIAVYDDHLCMTLACPDAPLVMPGGFGFGLERHAIPRDERPLLLGWPVNNYWSTNFCADPDGWMEFSYELTPSDQYDAHKTRALGQAAAHPWAVYEVTDLKKAFSGILFDCPVKDMEPVYIRLAQDGSGELIATFKNLSDKETEATFLVPGRKVDKAWVCDVQQVKKQTLQTDGETVCFTVPGKGLLTIRLGLR